MNTPATQQLQPQTIAALNNFLTIWNQDPLAANNSLTITSDSIVVHNESNIVTTLLLPLETEPELPVQHTENADILETYFSNIVFNDFTFSTEPTEEELDILSSQLDTEVLETPNKRNKNLDCLIRDFTEERNEVFARQDPLVGITSKEKLQEIINRLSKENRGRSRSQHIRILEASYYLGQLRNEVDDNKQRTNEIKDELKKALGPRRTGKAWKCAGRIYRLLQICGLPFLYSTTKITFSNLEELNEEDFSALLSEIRINGVNS